MSDSLEALEEAADSKESFEGTMLKDTDARPSVLEAVCRMLRAMDPFGNCVIVASSIFGNVWLMVVHVDPWSSE